MTLAKDSEQAYLSMMMILNTAISIQTASRPRINFSWLA